MVNADDCEHCEMPQVRIKAVVAERTSKARFRFFIEDVSISTKKNGLLSSKSLLFRKV